MNKAPLNAQLLEFISQKETSGALPPGAGIAVSVIKDGDVLYKGTFGLRERDRNLPVTPETVFEIGSLTKAFTATALAMASERGKLDLDQPINSSRDLITLSDSEASRKVSIADILSHRTGLPSNDLLWYFGPQKRDAQHEDLHRAVGRLDLLPEGFRKSFNYNNLLYGLLGHRFDQLIRESWESCVSRSILAPLKMTSTVFGDSTPVENVALPYVGTTRVPKVDMGAVGAAGTMRSSLQDMTTWMAFHLSGGKTLSGGQLLSESSIQLMQSKQIAVETLNPAIFQGLEWLGTDIGYGLGWFLGSMRGMKAVFHPGFIDGYSTSMLMIPEKKLGVVVLANVNLSSVPGLMIEKILSGLLDQDSAEPAAPTEPSAKDLSVIGKYENPAFGTVSVEFAGNRLALDYNGRKWTLNWKDETTAEFVITAFGLQMPLPVLAETVDGKVSKLSIPFSLDPRMGFQAFTRI